jgi:hypothetical protein
LREEYIFNEKQKTSTELIEKSNFESIQKQKPLFEQIGFNLEMLNTPEDSLIAEKNLQEKYNSPPIGNIGFYANNAQFGLPNKLLLKEAEKGKKSCPDFTAAIEGCKDTVKDYLNAQSFDRVHINSGGHNAFCRLIEKEIQEYSVEQNRPVKISFPAGEYNPMIELCKKQEFIIVGTNGPKNNKEHNVINEPIFAQYNKDIERFITDFVYYLETCKPDTINITRNKPTELIQKALEKSDHVAQLTMPEFPEYDGNKHKYNKEIKMYLDTYRPDYIVISQHKRNGESTQLDILFECLELLEARRSLNQRPRVIIDGCQSFGRTCLNLDEHSRHIYAYIFSAHKAASIPAVGGYVAQSKEFHEEYIGGGVETDPYYQLGTYCSTDREIFDTHVTKRLHRISELCIKSFETLAPDTIEIVSPQERSNMTGIITIKTPGIDPHEIQKLAAQYLITVNAEWYGEPGTIRLSFSHDQDDYHIAVITSRIAEIANTLQS